jgi:hypothetical protein
MKLNKRTIYIVLFAILYICVGLVSTIHAVSFFALANGMALAVILACAFEIGQAAVLFSILTDIRKRKSVMPWLLMGVLTLVQILGNVYSSYKYLITNSVDLLRFFKEPIFVWTTIPDANANVILTYVIGAVLPLVSLLMTAMLTSYLDKSSEEYIEHEEEDEEDNDEDNNEDNGENYIPPIEFTPDKMIDDEEEKIDSDISEIIPDVFEEQDQKEQSEQTENVPEVKYEAPVKEEYIDKIQENTGIEKPSHFINLE